MSLNQLPLHAAALAGKLAGIFCESLLELAGRVDIPLRPDDLDEAEAARFLEQDARDRGVGGYTMAVSAVVGTAESGLIDVVEKSSAAASETSPGRDSAAEEAPAPCDVPPARGAGHPNLATDIEDACDVLTAWLRGKQPTDFDPDHYRRLGERLRAHAASLRRLDVLLNRI